MDLTGVGTLSWNLGAGIPNELLNAPGWNPLNSAGSGSAFGGILAALVIAVSIQLALADASGAARHRWISLPAAASALATLMLATYFYIMLDGVPTSSEEVSQFLPGPDQLALATEEPTDPDYRTVIGHLQALQMGYANVAARGFCIGGTLLGLGALVTLLMIAAAVREGTRPKKGARDHGLLARAWADAVLAVAVGLIGFILLAGYNTGAKIAGIDSGYRWWAAHAFAMLLPLSIATVSIVYSRGSRSAYVLRCYKRHTEPSSKWRLPLAVLVLLVLLVVPTIFMVQVISTGPAGNIAAFVGATSLSSSAYYGLSSGAVAWVHFGLNLPRIP